MAPSVLRCATANVAHGGPDVDPDRFRAAIAALDVDVLALQEVDRDQPRSGHLDLTAVAADALGATTARFVPTVTGTPGRRWRAARGEVTAGTPAYGIAVVSRFPATTTVLRLGRIPAVLPVFSGGGLVLAAEEPRVAVVAEVAHPAGPVTVIATHLGFVPGWNALQLRKIRARAVSGSTGPVVVLGDLNLPAGVVERVSGLHPAVAEPTFPASRPRWQPDHVLVGDDVRVVRTEVRRLDFSDHRAVIVEIELPAAGDGA